jgi:hypothetical protein
LGDAGLLALCFLKDGDDLFVAVVSRFPDVSSLPFGCGGVGPLPEGRGLKQPVVQFSGSRPTQEQQELEAWQRSTTIPAGLQRRAKAVLLVSQATPIAQTARQAHLAEQHVRKWVRRFQKQRIPGLKDLPRPGRPPVFSP